jgi:hypothetical protein
LYLATPSSPRIFYYRTNESLVVNVGITSYTVSGRTESCYDVWDPNGSYCARTITEWGRRYQFQAIELIDWDTGEVYASVNQTSVTFDINANTIVRFKYVLVDSWSRSWVVIVQPPPPTPNECQQILNDPSKRCTGAWCSCLKTYDPEAWMKEPCCPTSTVACLSVHVTPCCSGDAYDACLNSWSGQGGFRCGSSLPVTVSWSASWSLKPGWALADIGKTGYGNVQCGIRSLTGGSASGSCTLNAEEHATQWVVVIFRRT